METRLKGFSVHKRGILGTLEGTWNTVKVFHCTEGDTMMNLDTVRENSLTDQRFMPVWS